MFGVSPYHNNTIYMSDAIVSIVTGVVASVAVCALALGVVLYVFRAFSLYKIARCRGISNAWLAWVPVCNDWVLGSVADQYQYVVKGRIKNRRLPLFLLGVIQLGLRIVSAALSASALTYMLRFVLSGAGYPDVGQWVLLSVVSVAQTGVTIAYLLIFSFVLYDVYTSCTNRNNVLFLVLSLIFRVLEPVFFFVCRNKEEGMPPRRDEPAFEEPETVEETEVPEAERSE